MEKAKQADDAKSRTCTPKWKGLKYVPSIAKHLNSELMTDDLAISLLDAGFLKPEDFTVLPKGYKDPATVAKEAKEKAKKEADAAKAKETK